MAVRGFELRHKVNYAIAAIWLTGGSTCTQKPPQRCFLQASESHLKQSDDIRQWCSGCQELYSHIHLAQVAMTVLNHMRVFGAVEGRDRTPAAFRAHVEVSRVDGHGH